MRKVNLVIFSEDLRSVMAAADYKKKVVDYFPVVGIKKVSDAEEVVGKECLELTGLKVEVLAEYSVFDAEKHFVCKAFNTDGLKENNGAKFVPIEEIFKENKYMGRIISQAMALLKIKDFDDAELKGRSAKEVLVECCDYDNEYLLSNLDYCVHTNGDLRVKSIVCSQRNSLELSKQEELIKGCEDFIWLLTGNKAFVILPSALRIDISLLNDSGELERIKRYLNDIRNDVFAFDDSPLYIIFDENETVLGFSNDNYKINYVESINEELLGDYLEKKGSIKNKVKRYLDKVDPKSFLNEVEKYYKGQVATPKLVMQVYNYLRQIAGLVPFMKTNILTAGPSGSGKTFFFATISQILQEADIDVPTYILSATNVGETSYKGLNIYNIYENLAEVIPTGYGFFVIDEIDKLLVKKSVCSEGTDVNKAKTSSLLNLIAGEHFVYEEKNIDYDSTHLFVAGCGAYMDMRKKEEISSSIGFLKDVNADDTSGEDMYCNITMKKLEDLDVAPEILGRFQTIINLSPIPNEKLKEIINDFKEELEAQYGYKIKVSNRAMNDLVLKARTKRGLRASYAVFRDIVVEAVSKKYFDAKKEGEYISINSIDNASFKNETSNKSIL